MDGPDPTGVHTRERLHEALAEVKTRSKLSLSQIVTKSGLLVSRHPGPIAGHKPVALTKQNVGGFTGGSRPQLPGDGVMVTFLVVCGIPISQLGEWLAALRRARTYAEPREQLPVLPRLPEHFVPRPAERRRVVEELRVLADRGGALGLASTAALHGTGGFGKTTLALDVCRLAEIRTLFPDAIVWIEVGQEPVLTALLADIVASVTGRPPARFGSVDAAAAALGAALADRRVLLVLDNVWEAVHLEPFLRGGPRCVRLVTSRRADVLPSGTTVLAVDRMDPDQAITLLGQGVPAATRSALFPLYKRSHRWPVVLGILNGVLRARSSRSTRLPLEQVVDSLVVRLDGQGLHGTDDLTDTHSRTVREVLAIGVQELANEANGASLRERFLSLAAFPPDQLIDFDVLTELWACDALEVRVVCDRLADRSLLGSVEEHGVRLHDVIRDHILHDHHPPVRAWAERVLVGARRHCAGGRWDLIPDAQAAALDRLAFLMVFTDHEDDLRDLLFDLRFMVRRIAQGGIAGLADDLATCQFARGRDPQLGALARIIELEGHLTLRAGEPTAIAATLWARLMGDATVRDLVSHRAEALAGALVPAHPMPDRPDPRLVRVSSGHTDRVISLTWQPDGEKLATGAADGVIRLWDHAGRALRTVELDAAINALAWSQDHLYVAAVVGESEICLVEPILGEVTERYEADGELTCLAWTPSGLAAGRGDGGVLIWDRQAGEVARPETTSASAVRAMQWAGDEIGLVVAHSDNTVARLGLDPVGIRTGLNVPRALAVRPGSAQAVIGAATNGLVLADLAATPPAVVAASEPTPGWITSAGWSHDGTWLAVGLQDGAVALWSTTLEGVRSADPDTPLRHAWESIFAAQPPLDYHGQRVAALTWHPRQTLLAVAAQTDTRLFDLRRDSEPPGQASGVNCLRRHPGRNLFAAGGMDGELIFCDAVSGTFWTVDAHPAGMRAVAFAPTGERLLTAAENGPMLPWDVDDRTPSGSVPAPVQLTGAIAWSPDGALVAVGGNREVAVLDGRTLDRLRSFDVPDLVNGLDFSPSGTWLAVATAGSDIGVYSADGEPARWLSSHLSSVGAVRWVDENRLASAGYDGQLIIWSPWEGPTGKVLRAIDAGGGAVWDVAVNDRAIALVTAAGLLSLHPLDGDERPCTVALDTALSSCDISADGAVLAAGGSAGIFLFTLPAWAVGRGHR
jgi:WD40 repeat protein